MDDDQMMTAEEFFGVDEDAEKKPVPVRATHRKRGAKKFRELEAELRRTVGKKNKGKNA